MSKCWYCNEELTTANYCDEHIGICTKCYGSMFKVGNDFVKGLTEKIADLEAKLAENEEDLKATTESLYASREYLEQLKSEKWALEKQLTEKEKDLIIKCRTIEVLVKKNEKNNQDKISFAVEQLEKLKKTDVVCMNRNGNVYILGSSLNEAIDNQIEELKKEMK